MDAIDYAIYRHLSRDGLVRFWASRRLVDPRITAREISDKVGLSEAGVRSRLVGLQKRGLLRGSQVSLNPSLFGVTICVSEVSLRTPREAERLFRDLSVVDGVLFARDLLDEADRKVAVYYISDTPAATARRTSLLRRFSPSGEVQGPAPYWIPECTRSPTPLDWRLLASFRRHPDGTLARHASDSRVSLKTTARRFHALLDSRACWWSHSTDSEEWPLALLRITLEPGVESTGVSAQIALRNENWLPVAGDGLGVDPERSDPPLAGLVPAERPAALEQAVRRTLEVDGVANVGRTFGLGSMTYSQWVDDQLASKLANRP